jgi:hypothetical protein
MPSPPLKVSQWCADRACFFAPPLKPALGRWYEYYRLENRLGRSQSLCNGSCVDGFATGLSIKRRRRQPRSWRPFSSFWPFFVFNSSDDKIYLNNRQGLVLIRIVDQSFYSRRLLAALARAAVKMRASVTARTGGVAASKALWLALPIKRYIWAVCTQKLLERK